MPKADVLTGTGKLCLLHSRRMAYSRVAVT